MAEPTTLTFRPEGWLDVNVARFWEERDEGYFKLFAQELDEPQIEATFYPEKPDNGVNRECRIYRNDQGDTDLVSFLISLPEQRYWLVYGTLARNQDNLKRLEVHITYESTDDDSYDGEVVEVQFDAEIGEYFSRPPTIDRRRP